MAKKRKATKKSYWEKMRGGEARNAGNQNDFHPTPPDVTEALLEREPFTGVILEPACGNGAMVDVLRRYKYRVEATDITLGDDFLKRTKTVSNVVTNPPFTKGRAEDFVRKALEIATRKVAILVPNYFVGAIRRYDLFSNRDFPFKAEYKFFRKPKFGPQKNCAPLNVVWLVWDRNHVGDPYIGLIPPSTKS